jgi:hypothetical protein
MHEIMGSPKYQPEEEHGQDVDQEIKKVSI